MLTRSRARVLAAALPAAALLLTACGSGDSTSTTATNSSTGQTTAAAMVYPLTIDNCGQKVTFTQAPQRVLILNGTSVGEIETFITLGLADKVIANAQSYGVSDDPEMVAKIKAVPNGGLTMNKNFDVPAEQVLALKPDLVVSTWSGGFDASMGFASRDQLTKAGINSLVNPVNCAYGAPKASAADKAAYDAMSLASSTDFVQLIGQVFDVQDKATQTISEIESRIANVRERVSGKPGKKVLIAFPGMSMMNNNGLPAVMSGGIYDDIAKASGGQNTFEGKGPDFTATVNSEQLAAAQVDVLVIGEYTPDGKPADEAAALFAKYPQWQASKTKSYVTVSDSIYLGPLNPLAVEKIAYKMHPDAF
jgi:iron complex transport system substrate-binding protein